jgi:hypothetical protein
MTSETDLNTELFSSMLGLLDLCLQDGSPTLAPLVQLLQQEYALPTPQYQYRELNRSSRQIRLLKFFPLESDLDSASTQHDATFDVSWDMPICRLETFNLQSAPRFMALSYMWGDSDSPKKYVKMDGKYKEVTSTLYDFLCFMRSYPYDHQSYPFIDPTGYIWVVRTLIKRD